jgi:integrase
LRFRRPDGRSAKLTLGRVDLSGAETADEPTLGGALTLRQARQLANEIDRKRARGFDVIADYQAAKRRAATEREIAVTNSFAACAKEFFVDHKTRHGERPRRWRGDARMLGLVWPRDCDPAKVEPTIIPGSIAANWATRPVTEIDSHDIYSLVDDSRRRGVPGLKRRNKDSSDARGRKVGAALGVLFRWLLTHRRIPHNPASDVWRPGPPPARARALDDDEIVAFWRACDVIAAPYGAVFKMLLLTGARLNEVAKMRREELRDDVWTIPADRTKNHRDHVLPLPPLTREIIAGLPNIEGNYVFTLSGRRPVSSWSQAKRGLDATIVPKMPPFRLHDLRRTCATHMGELKVFPHIIEAVLNHVSGHKAGVAGVYNLAQYADEKREALARWASHIEWLIASRPTDNVVPMPTRGRS